MRLALFAAVLCCPLSALAQQQQSIVVTRELRIDGVAAELVRPSRIHIGSDGRIIVLQPRDNAILVFDATGRLTGKFGRAGRGPGEFQNMLTSGLVGDSLWVYDLRSRRTTVVTPGFTFGRVIMHSQGSGATATSGVTNLPGPDAIYSDGSILATKQPSPAVTPAGSDNAGFFIERIARDGLTRRVIARITSFPTGSVGVSNNDFFSYVMVPHGTRSLFTVSDRGSRMAVLTPVFEGQGANSMHLLMLSPAGDTIFARNYPFTPERIPQAILDADHAELVKRGAASAIPSSSVAQAQVPRVYPPFEDLRVADDGTVWIALRAAADGSRPFLVLGPLGNPIGTATLPRNTTPMAVSATHFWGIELDADDVPSVVRYRWSRSGLDNM